VKISGVAVLVAGIALASAPLCAAADGARNSRAASGQDSGPAASADQLFEFHSGFWINLHHFLYEQAAIATAGPRGTPHEAELATDASQSAGLSEDEEKAWSDALAYYRKNMLRHNLLSDDDMVALKNRLEDFEGANTLARSDLDPALVAVLDEASPIYRVHWWPLHDATNKTWINAVMPLVDKNGATLAHEIAMAFETPWPDGPLRVDVVAYANFAGSYTTLHPSRVTVSSVDGGNQDIAALEVLFHAASSTLIEPIADIATRDFAAQQRKPPPGLARAILYFTSGFCVRQMYPDYTPYADRFQLWVTDEDWKGFRGVLVKDWQPRLEGKITLEAALTQLAADLGVALTAPAPPEVPVAPTPAAPPK
jgi:hypothetical protein